MPVKKLREAAGMRQVQLAKLLGVSQSTVCSWECGRKFPSTENLMKLADIFCVSTDEVLGRSRPGA